MANSPDPKSPNDGPALPPDLVLHTPKEIADALRISETSVRKLIREGKIPAYSPLPSKPRVPQAVLIDLIAAAVREA